MLDLDLTRMNSSRRQPYARPNPLQCFSREDRRVELFVVPELGEIEADRRCRRRRADSRLEPLGAASNRVGREVGRQPRRERGHGERRLLERRGRAHVSAPSAVGILRRNEPPYRGSRLRPYIRRARLLERAQSDQHAAGPVRRVLLARGVLIAEPQRNERAVWALNAYQVARRHARSRRRSAPEHARSMLRPPRQPGADRVRREIGAAAIEGQRPPSAAKRRHAAVAILQIEQPLDASRRGRGVSRRRARGCAGRAKSPACRLRQARRPAAASTTRRPERRRCRHVRSGSAARAARRAASRAPERRDAPPGGRRR